VLITFDDGRAGVLRHAAPVLARHRLPATAHVVTDWVEGRNIPDHDRYSEFLGWSELHELRGAGIEIGSHTISHRNLKRLNAEEVATPRG